MARIGSKHTKLELSIRSALHRRGLRFSLHAKDLPGSPDLVFRLAQVAVFVDGDFWHGYRYTTWKHTLTEYWQQKISGNRKRDRRNFQKLRRQGWTVIRVWGHEVQKNLPNVTKELERIIRRRLRFIKHRSRSDN